VKTIFLPRHEPRVFRWLRRFTIVTVCMHFGLSCWSFYRRIWQVQRIEVLVTSTVLAPSATVGYDVVTSGEVQNLMRFELVQGAQREILLEQRSGRNRISAYDPRLFATRRRSGSGPSSSHAFAPDRRHFA